MTSYIESEAESTLARLYHAATLPSLDFPEGMSSDEAQGWLNNEVFAAMFALNAGAFPEWPIEKVKKWGKCYQYGRGGRTVAPESWVSQNAWERLRVPDLEPEDYYEFMDDVNALVKLVKNWCSNLRYSQ